MGKERADPGALTHDALIADTLIQELRERLGRLTALVEEQQQQAARQRDDYDQRLARQQEQIETLQAQIAGSQPPTGAAADAPSGTAASSEAVSAPVAVTPTRERDDHATSRRALLKWGGAAAAAATVALVASEGQAAHANPANDGDPILAGNTTIASSETVLGLSLNTNPGTALAVVASNGSGDNDGILGIASGNGRGVYGQSAIFGTGPGVVGLGATGVIGTGSGTGTMAGVYGVNGSTSGASYGVYGEGKSSAGAGVYGTNDASGGTGVYGNSSGGGIGVFGLNSGGGIGVGGLTDGVAVSGLGLGATSMGVQGESDSGYGVMGASGSGVDLVVGDPHGGAQNRLWQIPQPSAGAPASGAFSTGEMIRDLNGELWLCIAGGSPGTWVRAAHAVAGYTGGATSYLSKPIRLLDTRGGDPLAFIDTGGPYTAAGSPYSLQIAGINWQSVLVPATAVGAIGKVTAVSTPAGGGFIALVPHGAGFSGTANLPFGPSATVATSFNVGLAAGFLDIIIGGNPTHVVIDLFAVVA